MAEIGGAPFFGRTHIATDVADSTAGPSGCSRRSTGRSADSTSWSTTPASLRWTRRATRGTSGPKSEARVGEMMMGGTVTRQLGHHPVDMSDAEWEPDARPCTSTAPSTARARRCELHEPRQPRRDRQHTRAWPELMGIEVAPALRRGQGRHSRPSRARWRAKSPRGASASAICPGFIDTPMASIRCRRSRR